MFALVAHAITWSGGQAQTLKAGGQVTFNAQWDPLAAFSLTPPSMSFTSGNTQGTLSIGNNGSTGSLLNWTGSIKYTNNNDGKNWLGASALSGNNIKTGSSNAQQVTVSVDPTGLPLGTYNAEIDFAGISNPGNHSPIPPGKVTVSFKKTVVNCPGDGQPLCPPVPSCGTFTATPNQVVVPGNSQLTVQCQDVANNGCSLTDQNNDQYPSKYISYQSTGDQYGDYTANLNEQVTPAQSNVYTFTCNGVGSGSGYQTSTNVSVSVSKPGQTECPPGGCTP